VRSAAVAAAGLLVTLALGACSVSAKHSSSAATTGTGTTGAGTGTSAGATGTGTGTSSTRSTTSTPTSSSGSGQPGDGHGKHAGKGLPAASSELAQTAGYGTYERCQGTCTGSVPAALRRPLHLPSADGGPCPITIHTQGPVAPRQLPAGVGFHSVDDSQWLQAEVTWTVAGSYTGPLLIRGEMVGGGALGFGTGATPYDELQLLDAGKGAPRVVENGRAWITDTRIRSGGCYAYQVDGTDFSDVVVFRAVA
jgi:hypothetical protein